MMRPQRALALVLGLAPVACTLGPTHPEPLPLEATLALSEARSLERARPDGWRVRAEDAARRAQAAAPDWVAPRRVLDDLEREELRGPEALAGHVSRLAQGARADELYLAGRLEGSLGLPRIEHAARLEPGLAWAQHGLGWNLAIAGRARAALRAGARALELARGSYELGVFSQAMARYWTDLGRGPRAVEVLERTLSDPRLDEPERTEVEVLLARTELESTESEIVRRGFWRAIGLFEARHLTPEEYDALGARLLRQKAGVGDPDPLSVVLAALDGTHPEGSARLRAQVLSERGAHALAAASWRSSGNELHPGPFQRARELEKGDAAGALDRWCEALPAQVKDDDGLPREERLRALVLAARSAGSEPGAARLGQALLDTGWFAEAEAWAAGSQRPGGLEPEAALELATRAAAGTALLSGLRSVLADVDEGRPVQTLALGGGLTEPAVIEDLDGLLRLMQPYFERFHGAPLAVDLTASPRLSFAGLASVVHPGPRFSVLDEREGRGRAGERVPGLASELAGIGRFGIFGQAPGGGGPDGTLLRLVGTEWREGSHLGVPYAGLVAWCEGVDLESRPGRHGSAVSGAALHEGYWVDIEGVRREWARIADLEKRMLDPDGPDPVRALDGRGPELASDASTEECARWRAPLGEGDRVLLAVLHERAPPPAGGSRVPLEELVEMTALHEEGHLTDRTRFLPLSGHWLRVLGLVVRNGFSPRAIQRALEYRAQLVAVCAAPEPRIALAECLNGAESEGGVLAHGEAYRLLVQDFLEEVRLDLPALPALDPTHYLLFQLHFLGAEDVRRLALRLAARRGMVAD